MLTAVAAIAGALAIGFWALVAWGAKRRQPLLLAPMAVLVVGLVVVGEPAWAFLPAVLLAAGSFTELVIGSREAPALRAADPDAPLTTERWAAAVAAPFRVALAEPWDEVERPQLRRRYRRAFEREWGVVDRASLLAAVDRVWADLHSGGDCDLVVDFRAATLRGRLRSGAPEERVVGLTPDQVGRLRAVTGADPASATVVIGAHQWWRSAQIIRLACGGATLEWLSGAETRALLRRAAADLQRRYPGWQQYAEAFHAGYLLWYGQRGPGWERVWTALGLLVADPASPWNLLPWDMPLERVGHEAGAPSAQPR
ncbi:DUF1266 domain-containing protein [Streptomonospora nanhaiensis]|uniref:DUF1266 domain-containing protein n=1 Tax=Streptomonospora nanhaiensis TaxID=1323731 RepID=A0A853BJ91_9ACTN|nr:DUF1266 domain-containing protein [Streptomonospora nanhaiensis]MBV2366815.1 DUF1266 domain-containing protein [Streptomonospora nanhaiensis]MBX9390935.1 DUF1266 domain-containing protein [Streptomonospora nanhaiensis]NYI94774.1 hypothetical protein [Streptomonospora nanhaiensis]